MVEVKVKTWVLAFFLSRLTLIPPPRVKLKQKQKIKGSGVMKKLLQLEAELQASFPEREAPIRGLILGLLTGRHVLFVGPPGTGKSMLVNELAGRFLGARKFCYLMTKYTRPEEIIGAVSLKHLEVDEFKRVLTGKTADAHLVFLDEVFNAGSGCVNAILTIMNEGLYYNGTEAVPVPLISLVGASNEVPYETRNEMAAFYDRFLLKFPFDYIESTEQLAKMLALQGDNYEKTCFTIEEVKQWQAAVLRIQVPGAITGKIIALVVKLRQAGLQISDRRIKESLAVLKSNAFLAGRKEVAVEDLDILQFLYCQRPDEIHLIREQLLEASSSVDKKAGKLLGEARQIKMRILGTEVRGRRLALAGELNLRLTEINEELKQLIFLGTEDALHSESADAALVEVEEIQQQIIGNCLGALPEGAGV